MFRNRRAALALALMALVGGLALTAAGQLDGVDNALLALCFRLRGPVPPAPEISIVSVDPMALRGRTDARALLEFEAYAELLEKLRDSGAKVIALDIPPLTTLPRDYAGDECYVRLVEAVRACGNVVLPCVLEPRRTGSQEPTASPPLEYSLGPGSLRVPAGLADGVLTGPPPDLAAAAAGVGHINVYPDSDGAVRSLPLATCAGKTLWPSLALEVARVYQSLPPGSARLAGMGLALGDTRLDVSPDAEMMINFAGGYRHYPYVPLAEVLAEDPSALKQRFQGKVVLVGPTSHVTYWRTPIHPVMPGVELAANAIGNMIHGTELRQPGHLIGVLVALLAALFLGLAVSEAGAIWGTVAGLAGLIGACVIVVVLFAGGVWLPMGTALFTIAVGGLVLVIRSAARADRARAKAEARFDSRIEAIAGIGTVVVSATQRTRLLNEILRWVERELNVPAVSVLLMDERGHQLRFEVASGEKGNAVKDFTIAIGEGIVGTVAATGEPLVVQDAASDPRHLRQISEAVGFPVESVVAVPIKLREQVIGVIEALNKQEGSFTPEDVSLLTVLAQQAALFLETASLYSDMERRVAEATADLRKANQDIASQKAKLETLLAEMESGVIATDPRDKVVTWNRAAERLLGVTQTEALGKSVVALMDNPDLAALVSIPLERVDGRYEDEIELPVDERVMIVRASVTYVGDAEVHGKLILLMDITQLKELDRMKTDFLSFVSHELQNPLASIRGFSHLLLQKTDDTSPNARLIRFLDQQSTRMQWLVEDFLDMSRIDSGAPLAIQAREIEDLYRLVEQVVNLHSLTTQDHSFVINIEEGTPLPWGDRRKLEQTLVNLVGNAVKYSPDGGEVRITVEPHDGDVLFSVYDEGMGIRDEDMPNLFQRFRRAPESRERVQGTGIGLFLCRYLVQAQGGQIYAEQRDKGTVFRFTLPVQPQEEVEGEADAPTSAAETR